MSAASLRSCSRCGRAFPTDAGTLGDALLALELLATGAVTGDLAAAAGRRRADVLATLNELRNRGLVERRAEPKPHAPNRTVWRLRSDTSGIAGEQPQGEGRLRGD